MKQKKARILFLVFFLSTFSLNSFPDSIPPPEKILGFKVGQDYKLARWSQILNYFDTLASLSNKISVIDLGKSTLGRRFIMAVISSPANMLRLNEIKEIQKRLHDPRLFQSEEKEELLATGKAIVMISCSLHSREIASSLMSLELAHKLITEETPEIQQILEETVLLLLPSVNPDGIDLVSDWYYKYLGTPYEASQMPWLYHYYTGHDNNRDWFMLTQKETQLVTHVLYHEWFPLLVYDVHQMGSYGPRYFIPPYYDPINPNIDPLLLREIYLLTSNASVELTKEGKKGIATNALFDAWYSAANRASPLRHNVMGILSEAASAKLASPMLIKREQLRLKRRGLNGSGIQASFLEPWPGGWWRIRDIIDYEEITALAFLKTIAMNKEKYLSNFALYAQRQIKKGKEEPPFAYLIPLAQKDLPTAYKLLQILQDGGAEIYRAKNHFVADGVRYPAETFILPLNQPYRVFIKDLLEKKVYPLRYAQSGRPEFPYDEAAWTLPLQMGISTVEVNNPFSARMNKLEKIGSLPTKIIQNGSRYFIVSNETNNASILINRLHKQGVKANFIKKKIYLDGQSFSPGAILFSAAEINPLTFSNLTKNLGLTIFSTDKRPETQFFPLKKPKIGIYQSWIANMDEGWLRWTLEEYEFPFKLLHNKDIKTGELSSNYSHIILPSMSPSVLIDGRKKEPIPLQYSGGIETEGIRALESFIQAGGTLIAIGQSSDFAIEHYNLPVKNLVDSTLHRREKAQSSKQKELNKDAICCPGSLLKIHINDQHPVGYGMGKEGVIFSRFSPVFSTTQGELILSYPLHNPLLSGVILNEDKLSGQSAAVEFGSGKGKILLLGFKVVHRAQAHGSFKFLFNALLY